MRDLINYHAILLKYYIFEFLSVKQRRILTHSHKQHDYQAVVVGKSLCDEDIVEMLHQDPLAVQALQVRHGEPLQVVCSETIERHQQQRHNTWTSRVVFSG